MYFSVNTSYKKAMRLKFKKDRAEMGTAAIELLIAITYFFFMVTTIITLSNQILDYTKANAIARDYLYMIEMEGYLSDESQEQLINALNTTSLTDISLEGSTMEKLSNGDTGHIVISGKMSGINIKISKSVIIQN